MAIKLGGQCGKKQGMPVLILPEHIEQVTALLACVSNELIDVRKAD